MSYLQEFISNCPACDSGQVAPEMRSAEPFGIRCDTCGWTGPREGWDDNPDAAIMAWEVEIRQIRQAQAQGLTINWRRPIPGPQTQRPS